MKPLAYGYMRVPQEVPDYKVLAMERRIKDFAEEQGFEFGTIFHEFRCAVYDAWGELTTQLQRADAHHVIVPSMNHIARHPILCDSIVARLEDEAKAEVLSLQEHENEERKDTPSGGA